MMSGIILDMNADLGESASALDDGSDFELMRYITSANVACGGHAGDASTMTRTLTAAKELGVSVGAHPSYPDRANFGRVAMSVSPRDIEAAVGEQLRALIQVSKEVGVAVVHVKPHGALYHAARNPEIAQAVGRAVLEIDPKLIMVGQTGSASLQVWREMGLCCAAEAFADRAYEQDGSLRKRDLPGAVLTPQLAAEQAVGIAVRQMVRTSEGNSITVAANTICIHSDTTGAAAIAREIRSRLAHAGVQIQPLSRARACDKH